ncbi:hypothetical protein [Nitratidesulfovibrio sp.]|uniref:hypothetical protein n=1 Tax=Nitratidesulfovibrio sp. TaxID=2802297 RepID=UPI00333E9857
MDEKRYCVHAALGTRGERLRLVRIRPEPCQHGGQEGKNRQQDDAPPLDEPAPGIPARDDPPSLPLSGARPVVLAEGLTARQAERLAALLSGLVDADVARAAGTMDAHAGSGSGELSCIAPAQTAGKGIAVPEGTPRKAQAGLNLLREALLSVMACNPRGLTGPELLFALGLDGGSGEPGIQDGRPHGADLLVRGLLELLREAGAVRGGDGR